MAKFKKTPSNQLASDLIKDREPQWWRDIGEGQRYHVTAAGLALYLAGLRVGYTPDGSLTFFYHDIPDYLRSRGFQEINGLHSALSNRVDLGFPRRDIQQAQLDMGELLYDPACYGSGKEDRDACTMML